MARKELNALDSISREAIEQIRTEEDFIEFLRHELEWPIPFSIDRLDDVAIPYDLQQDFGFAPEEDRIRVSRLLNLTEEQPWAIFLFEFQTKRPYLSHLRKLLRGLGSRKTLQKGDPIWSRSDILFICVHDWTDFQFVHFSGEKAESAVISSFGWHGPEDNFLHTLCKHNLPKLRFPAVDQIGSGDGEKWRTQWSEAFNIKPVTDEFYSTLKEVFNAVQAGVQGLEGENRRFFAELVVNRMVFLKFVEKKGWLNNDLSYLYNRFKKYGNNNYWKDFLFHFFFEGLNTERLERRAEINELIGDVPFLNAELFAKSYRWNDDTVEIDNRVFDLLFDKLLNPYNFTVCETSPLDVEVAFNQDLLGYGYEELIADQHGQGAYYTHPREVNLMCRESLRAFLESRCSEIGKELIGKLVYGELTTADKISERDALALYRALHDLTMVDPALGSGTFPVAMMKHLFIALRTLGFYLKESSEFEEMFKQDGITNPNDAFALKLHIIERSIYGCDIDYFAVQIAKLRFWIELMVDCDKPEALPNFNWKLVVGDALVSVVGTDNRDNLITLENLLGHPTKGQMPLAKKFVDQLAELKREYFMVREATKRAKLEEQINRAREELLRQLGIHTDKINRTDKHVLWQIDFAEMFTGREPGFDIAIANPPYLRQELIDRAFEEFALLIKKGTLRSVYGSLTKTEIDGKADLYIYFFLRSLMLLRSKNSVCTFICSTSWLDDDFGSCLQRYLSFNCKNVTIIENQYKRAFDSADINAAISVFVPGDVSEKKNPFSFIALRAQPTSHDVLIQRDSKIRNKGDTSILTRLVEHNELFPILKSSSEVLRNGKWGARFLRMPPSLEKLITAIDHSFGYLGDLCSFEYGSKPGIVEFFIIDRERIEKHGIEDDFCVPIITSTKEIETPIVRATDVSKYAFVCKLTKDELRRKGYDGALKYIEWGETQVSQKSASHTVSGVPWPNVKSVSGNRPSWYSYDPKNAGSFVVPALIRERFFYAYNADNLPDTNMFYHGTFDQHVDTELQCALLNCTLTYLATEVYGRINIGGRLNLYGTEYRQLPVLSGRTLRRTDAEPIINAFRVIAQRRVLPIMEEIKQRDRHEFDEIVLSSFGLGKHGALDPIYADFRTLVSNRLSRESLQEEDNA